MKIDDAFLQQYDHALVCAQIGTPKMITHNQDNDIVEVTSDYTNVDRDIAYMGNPLEIMKMMAETIVYMGEENGISPMLLADDISGMVEELYNNGDSEINQYN